MQQTTNYNLNKFDSTDALENTTRLGLNENADTIDTALKGLQDDIDGLDAADVPYDNTVSGLTATDVQAALDEELDKIDILSNLADGMIIQPSVSAASVYEQWVYFAENTLPKGYRWLLLGTINWSISSSAIQTCAFNFGGSETSIAVDCRTVGNGGGGCAMWGYCETRNAARTVRVRSYGAVNQTYNHNAQYIAIPLQKF